MVANKHILKDKENNLILPVTHIDCIIDAPDAKELFIDMWNQACIIEGKQYGKYNRETGYFELNGITDIGYEEALRIYALKDYSNLNIIKGYYVCGIFPIKDDTIRTIFPIYKKISFNTYLDDTFYLLGNKIEVIAFVANFNSFQKFKRAFTNNNNLREVKGVIQVNNIQVESDIASPFDGDTNLEEFRMYGLKVSLNLTGLSKLSYDTMSYLVENAINESPITITVHQTVYSKLTDESNEEWSNLNSLAQSKQITFATV